MISITDIESSFCENAPADVKWLEEIARREIKDRKLLMPRKRAFLIFRSRDLDQVNSFRDQIKGKDSHIDFIDFALKVHFKTENAEYVRHCITKRIENCSVAAVLVGKMTYDCEWVDWEIRECLKLGIRIVAVRLDDNKRLKIPKALTEHKIRPLQWDQDNIDTILQDIDKSYVFSPSKTLTNNLR